MVEIDALFGDFEQMADSLDKRARYLRDFASSVSHEFKTPLAAISGAIELLQDHGAANGAGRAHALPRQYGAPMPSGSRAWSGG